MHGSKAIEPMRSSLARLLRYVRRHDRIALATLGFGTLGFLLSFAYPWIIGTIVDAVSAPTTAGGERVLVRMTVLAVVTALLQAGVVYGRGHASTRLGHAVVTDLRRELFTHVQGLGVSFFTRARTGTLLSCMMHDAQEAAAVVYTGLVVVALDMAQVAIAIFLLAQLSGPLTLACVVLLPVYGLVFALRNPRVREASEAAGAHLSGMSGTVAEQLAGQALIKTYTAEEREAARTSKALAEHHRLVVDQSHQGHLLAATGEVLVHLGTTLVVGYGGWLALRGTLTAGEMTRFLGYLLILFGPVRRFAELNTTYQTSLSALGRVFAVLDVRTNVPEPALPLCTPPRRGRVRFEGVGFRYEQPPERVVVCDDDEPPISSQRPSRRFAGWVLDDVTLDVLPGERIAIVGPSGAGKTSLVSLVPRLHDVSEGRVTVDGVDVRTYATRALRAVIAVVQQDSFLFTGTIRENIAYGRPDATEQEILDASIAAHAHDFVRKLPLGYRTQLGERGVNLSGGQRQRLSIARALLKDPRILILDEATSALDAESEEMVRAALERLMRGRTCFLVAHRLSTIRNADRIVVMDQGRIAEVGTHAELLRRDGVYARLVRHQMTREAS